jgi:hypothetical protein
MFASYVTVLKLDSADEAKNILSKLTCSCGNYEADVSEMIAYARAMQHILDSHDGKGGVREVRS